MKKGQNSSSMSNLVESEKKDLNQYCQKLPSNIVASKLCHQVIHNSRVDLTLLRCETETDTATDAGNQCGTANR